uniref:(northern house mosquito) hypothetical protein n=1 Tax=Culex pipiens TaxID=7175 RepID=A0A8D8P2R0_CULPI
MRTTSGSRSYCFYRPSCSTRHITSGEPWKVEKSKTSWTAYEWSRFLDITTRTKISPFLQSTPFIPARNWTGKSASFKAPFANICESTTCGLRSTCFARPLIWSTCWRKSTSPTTSSVDDSTTWGSTFSRKTSPVRWTFWTRSSPK